RPQRAPEDEVAVRAGEAVGGDLVQHEQAKGDQQLAPGSGKPARSLTGSLAVPTHRMIVPDRIIPGRRHKNTTRGTNVPRVVSSSRAAGGALSQSANMTERSRR